MATVRGHTSHTRHGRPIFVNTYVRRNGQTRIYRKQGLTYQPDIDTAALYNPSKPGNPFAGRRAEGQPVPKGLRSYPFDKTELVQAQEKDRWTMGRTRRTGREINFKKGIDMGPSQ
jgi:hypothetical protein